MANRINWRPSSQYFQNSYNFKWKDTSHGIDFKNSNSSLCLNRQVVNHFSGHQAISNKQNLFLNMIKYCEKKGLDIFKYIPFTVCMNYESHTFHTQLDNFKDLYNNINSYLLDFNNDLIRHVNPPKSQNKTSFNFNNSNDKKNLSNIKRYCQKFSYSSGSKNTSSQIVEKIGLKSLCYIPNTHYDNRNLWLVKAINLNRGRGIKLCNSIEDILSFIVKVHSGISKKVAIEEENMDDEEEKTIKNEPYLEGCSSGLFNKKTSSKVSDMENFVKTNGKSKKKSFNEEKKKKSSVKKDDYKDENDFNFLKPIDIDKNDNHSQRNVSKSYDPKKYNLAIQKLNKKIYSSSEVIIQKYIERPLLYYGRKCDMRLWVLLTNKFDLYAFKEGHLKVSSVAYDLQSKDTYTHITNYSVQKHNQMFGYYEIGNEISFEQFHVNF